MSSRIAAPVSAALYVRFPGTVEEAGMRELPRRGRRVPGQTVGQYKQIIITSII